MTVKKVIVCVLLEYYWKKGLNVSAALYENCSVEGEGTVDDSIVWNGSKVSGLEINKDIKDKPSS